MAERCSGLERIPAEVGFFHHGSYVGPRSRIAMKVAAWTHSGAVANDWVERVWDRWTPAWRNFHPVSPSAFPSAHRIAPEELPSEIRDWAWPEGYLEGAD